jgi:hypothetical protein
MGAKRSFWTGLLAVVLLLGVVDLHPAGDLHDSLAPHGGGVYFPSAQHPDKPTHFEPAQAATQPHCPVCLHRLQTSGAHLPPAVFTAPPQERDSAACAYAPVAAGESWRPTSARAPPTFS